MIFSLDLTGVRIRENSPLNTAFLYNLFLRPEFKGFVKGYANGTTVLHLNKDGILNFRFVCPPVSILESFGSKVQPMLEAISANELQIEILTRTRDYLLPKLLSGEVEINDTNSNLEAVP